MDETYEYKGYIISVANDEWADDPNEWGNYTVKQWREVDGIDEDERTISDELKAKLKDGKAFWVDKYEHSAVRYSLTVDEAQNPYGEWDTSRTWGIIEFSDEYATNCADYAGRREMARQDLEEYTAWANGAIYRSDIYEPDADDRTKEGELIDGGSGFIDFDEAKSFAESTVDGYGAPRESRYAKKASKLHE